MTDNWLGMIRTKAVFMVDGYEDILIELGSTRSTAKKAWQAIREYAGTVLPRLAPLDTTFLTSEHPSGTAFSLMTRN